VHVKLKENAQCKDIVTKKEKKQQHSLSKKNLGFRFFNSGF
jgi:hypothetical protein